MSMREEVLKLARKCGWPKEMGNELPDTGSMNFERFYQAAYLAGAKAMQGEAEKRCEKDLYRGEHFAEVIREINLESLGNK